MRYKLRSSSKVRVDDLSSIPWQVPVASMAASNSSTDEATPPKQMRLQRRRRRKTLTKALESTGPQDQEAPVSKCTLRDLPKELLLHICSFLDSRTLLHLLQTCKWLNYSLSQLNPFWKEICTKEELSNYSCLLGNEENLEKVGWNGTVMQCKPPEDLPSWRRVFMKGLHMRKNIWQSNFEGWRIYANSSVPVVKLSPDLDLNEVKKQMGTYPKLSENDDLKIDWDDKHLVVFHFFRGEVESCIIRLWDISDRPKFLYSVDKNLECITDKVSVVNDHVVIVPSWPLAAKAIVMTMEIKNNMAEVGKFLFADERRQISLDEQWEHTQLRVIKNEAMVVCRCPNWCLIVVSLPQCQPLFEVTLDDVSTNFDCQQIRSYKNTAMILFSRKSNDTTNILVTVDVMGSETKVRSSCLCYDVADVALFTDPEEIYIMKRNGDVVMYDANTKTEQVKICNDQASTSSLNEYQLFVNRKEQICVMQSCAEVSEGRHVKVYTCNDQKLYTINLDLLRYAISRDESICIYTNGAFLAAADSKKFTMFNVRTGKHVGNICIPSHLERTKGKEEKDCMFEQTGLSLFIFDEDKLIAVHDYERSFPAVLDIYKFW